MANIYKNALIMQLNICGCSPTSITALNAYINEQQAKVVFLSETKTTTLNDNDFNNYQVLLKPNQNNPKQMGGVAILIHHDVMVERLPQLESDGLDTIFAAITIDNNKDPSLFIICPSPQFELHETHSKCPAKCHSAIEHLQVFILCGFWRF